MKKNALVFLLLLIALVAKTQTPVWQNDIEGFEGQQLIAYHPVDGQDIAQNAHLFLQRTLLGSYPAGTQLLLSATRKSPLGTYYTYQLHYNNTIVYGRTAKLFIDNNNTIRWVHHNLAPYTAPASTSFLGADAIKTFALQHHPQWQWLAGESVWASNAGEIIPAFSITLKNNQHYSINQYLYSTSGTLLYINAIDKQLTATDTPAYAYVNNPDPLTTAGKPYGGVYSDTGGADTKELTAQRQKLLIRGTLQGDSVVLANDDFFVEEISTPIWQTTKAALGDTFNFTRSQHQFADVCAFYHLNTFLAHVRTLGYKNLPGFKIKVDAHALNGQDASRFTASDVPPSLQYGDGGVPDAEDADVVVHEMGHALSFGASPNTSIGTERRALDEALGDYFAASYSWNINTYNWQKVFNWDGNNGGWQGRTVAYNGNYKQLTNNIWTDGQLWSTAFMRILRMIGRDKADKLMLEALYRLSANMKMPQLANAVLQIDSLQNNGANTEQIQCAFASVNILDSASSCQILGVKNTYKKQNTQPVFEVYNSWGFANYGQDISLVFMADAPHSITIFDATGKQVYTETVDDTGYKTIKGQNFAPGIYFLKVRNMQTGITQAAKLLRY